MPRITSCRIRVTSEGADVDVTTDGPIRTVHVTLSCGASDQTDSKRVFPPDRRCAGFVPIHLVTFPVSKIVVRVCFADGSDARTGSFDPSPNQWVACREEPGTSATSPTASVTATPLPVRRR
jgi:hypothetical protein